MKDYGLIGPVDTLSGPARFIGMGRLKKGDIVVLAGLKLGFVRAAKVIEYTKKTALENEKTIT